MSSAPMPAWERVKQEFRCDCERTVLTLTVRPDGSRLYRRQCLNCGKGSPLSASALSERERASAVAFDEEISRRHFDARLARQDQLIQAERDRERRQFDAWYADYLRSPLWHSKRRAVMARAHSMCEGCMVRVATQVHHLTYVRVGNEMLFDLVAICDRCHDLIHERGEGPRVP